MIEKAPFQRELERPTTMVAPSAATYAVPTSDWRQGLPVLRGARVRLREVRIEDAASLVTMLAVEEVTRFTTPVPATVEGFERFIRHARDDRSRGEHVCYAVVPDGMDEPVGIVQARTIEPGFGAAELSFAIGSAFWGAGIFEESANLVLSFVFDTLGVHRLEARTAVANGRGNGALRKIGAVQEGLLRRSFMQNGAYHDQVLWSILAEDWQFLRRESRPRIH